MICYIMKNLWHNPAWLVSYLWLLQRKLEKKEIIWRRVSFFVEEKEKDEIIWKKKTFFGGGEEKQKEKEANIWWRKISVFVGENKNEEGKGGKNMEKEFCG